MSRKANSKREKDSRNWLIGIITNVHVHVIEVRAYTCYMSVSHIRDYFISILFYRFITSSVIHRMYLFISIAELHWCLSLTVGRL